MRIGINAQRFEGQRLGVARYIEYLLKHWATMLEPSEEVVLYLRRPLPPGDPLPAGPFRAEVLRPELTGLAWENVSLRRGAKGADVLFGPSYTLPLAYRGRSVVALHSVNEVWPGTHPWWYRHTYSRLYRASARRATRVIVVSQSIASDIQGYYGIPDEKIDVVPNGVDDIFRPLDDQDAVHAAQRTWIGDDRPYILFVGKLSQRRNIPVLLEAFARAKQAERLPHVLLLFGPNHLDLPLEQLTRELGIADSVLQTDGRLSRHAELVPVYNGADLFVSASSYEGFSLTMVEAMACGTPVVAVDRAAQREIVDGAGLLVDEATVDALADAIARMLGDDQLRSGMRERGLERARLFRWEHAARRTLEVLRRAATAA